jgi:hypothetical protein
MAEHKSLILSKSECKGKKDYAILSAVAITAVLAQLFLATQIGLLAAQIINL